MRALLIFFFLISFLTSNDEFQDSEKSLFDFDNNQTKVIIEQNSTEFSDADEENLSITNNIFEKATIDHVSQTKLLYAYYDQTPQKIYKNQRFFIDIKCKVVTDEFEKIETRFLNIDNIFIINSDSPWEFDKQNSYKNRYYFKAQTSEFKMPEFQILLINDDKIVDTVVLKAIEPTFLSINESDKLFSKIIAKDIVLKSVKTRQYNNKELLTTIELELEGGNLEDFHINGVREQGVLSFEENYPKQTMFYYFITPIFQKELIFRYFDFYDNRFKPVNIPITVEEDLVSTQTDLNPNNSNLLFYKRVIIGIIVLLFFIVYLIRKKITYIFLAVLFLVYFTFLILPNKIVILKANSEIRIVPTSNSTVFYNTDKDLKVELLDKKEGFVKILFRNTQTNRDNIGWVKELQIGKN